ncbi:MAG TPA: aldehyde dehydrogenase family protein, partial [Pseudonocardiaceae bacterium]|nr:aldehyde dehydrogenase family protein [Pseudonocardiaceae bacterium]
NPSDTTDVIGEFAAGLGGHHRPAAVRDSRHGGGELLRRSAELGDLPAREEGKTLAEGIGEVARAGQLMKFHGGGQALRNGGEHIASTRPGVHVTTFREPLGVVSLITPWNFPSAIPAWKLGPVLAYGNAVVFKPAELVPGSA